MGKANIYAVIMAGGVGSRFWPRSRERSPKQLMEIVGDRTMIQNTVERLNGFVAPENIFVITNKLQKHGVIKQASPASPRKILSQSRSAEIQPLA